MRSLLFLPEPGTALQNRRGQLCVRDKEQATETLYPPRNHNLRSIILGGTDASITAEAIRWCGREGVALFLMNQSEECVAVLVDAPEADARRRALILRERQWRRFLDRRKRLEVARKSWPRSCEHSGFMRGVVRLGPHVAQEVAATALRTAPMAECVKTVRRIVSWF